MVYANWLFLEAKNQNTTEKDARCSPLYFEYNTRKARGNTR